jgi:hypothetical protein
MSAESQSTSDQSLQMHIFHDISQGLVESNQARVHLHANAMLAKSEEYTEYRLGFFLQKYFRS